MTEDKAKTKWCPHSRVGVNAKEGVFGRWHNFTANRFAGKEVKSHCNCMASGCMMWVQTDNECEPVNPKELAHKDQETACFPAGYCGLTGAK